MNANLAPMRSTGYRDGQKRLSGYKDLPSRGVDDGRKWALREQLLRYARVRSVYLLCFILMGMPMAVADALRAGTKPNVVIILADDLGYSDLGCYGGEIATPHLDSLARDGLRFTQFYNTARCWPTRAALLSGYYAQQVRRDALPGSGGGGQGVRPAWARLLPELLKPAGYRSYHSGKWHIDGEVLASGFARSFHMRNDGNYFSVKGNLLDDQLIEAPEDETGYYATTATADHAIQFLREHAREHVNEPYFLYVAFIAPHFPLHALPGDIARYQDQYLEGWEVMRAARFARLTTLGIVNTTLSAIERDLGPPYDFPESMVKLGSLEVNRPVAWMQLTEAQRRFQATKMSIHAAMVDRMDREIGRVLAEIRAMPDPDNTLMIFASDNGASAEIMVRHGGHDPRAAAGSAGSYLCLGPGFSSACNAPFRRHKTWVHEGGISSPLIVHWPKGIRDRGQLRHTPAHVIDVVPTVLGLAGVDRSASWQGEVVPKFPGRSLAPAFKEDCMIQRDSLWWLHEGHRAVRVGRWKLVAARDQAWELYDMTMDRAEQQNVAGEQPGLVKELEQLWQRQAAEFERVSRP